jgi:hypothetical protein
MLGCAFGDDDGAPTEDSQRASTVVRRAAGTRRSSVDEVARQAADHPERLHARESTRLVAATGYD